MLFLIVIIQCVAIIFHNFYYSLFLKNIIITISTNTINNLHGNSKHHFNIITIHYFLLFSFSLTHSSATCSPQASCPVCRTSFADFQDPFAYIQGSFADIQGSFALNTGLFRRYPRLYPDISGSFADIQGSFAGIQDSFADL